MHKKQSLPTCAGIALALLVLTASGRADTIWSYDWTPSSSKVNANAGGPGYLTLTNEPDHTATGSSNTVITNIQAASTASSSNPATFNQVPISFALQLEDATSKATSTVTFSGYFGGYITANSANVQLTFTTPTTETLTLGGNQYKAVVGTYTPPGPPGAANAGSLNAFVTVTPTSGGGGIASVPEPAALTLACLALPIASLCGWRKRRSNLSSVV
jgi:hypothetical protein